MNLKSKKPKKKSRLKRKSKILQVCLACEDELKNIHRFPRENHTCVKNDPEDFKPTCSYPGYNIYIVDNHSFGYSADDFI